MEFRSPQKTKYVYRTSDSNSTFWRSFSLHRAAILNTQSFIKGPIHLSRVRKKEKKNQPQTERIEWNQNSRGSIYAFPKRNKKWEKSVNNKFIIVKYWIKSFVTQFNRRPIHNIHNTNNKRFWFGTSARNNFSTSEVATRTAATQTRSTIKRLDWMRDMLLCPPNTGQPWIFNYTHTRTRNSQLHAYVGSCRFHSTYVL